MRVFAYAPLHFEPWDFRTPDTTGIGGSETCVVETARILATRGHDVTVYAPLADSCPERDAGGARWLPLEAADFTAPGVWILHRCPSALDNFAESHPHQSTWLVCQDVFYPPQLADGLTPKRSAKLDKCLPLCEAQEKWLLEKSPELAGKLFRSSNGVRVDVIRQIESVIARDDGNECPYCLGRGGDTYGDHYFSKPDITHICPECGKSHGEETNSQRISVDCGANGGLATGRADTVPVVFSPSNGVRVDVIREIENGNAELDSKLPVLPRHSDPSGGECKGNITGMPGGSFVSETYGGICEDKFCTGSKGISRDPYRIIFTSSPDRGLASLLKIFKRAREFEPRLNLVAAYGFDNIDKCEGPHWKKVKAECMALMDQPNVRWLGRMPQKELYKEFLAAGMWVYPTCFTETSCVTCMEAQSLGAIPITNPLWALADNVRHGTFIHGDPQNDPLVRSRYVGEIVRMVRTEGLQEKIRGPMMAWARGKFSWERVVDQWEAMALGYDRLPGMSSYYAQYAFQLKHATGKVLNLGCNCDLPGFGERGAVNVDLHSIDPFTKAPNKARVVADIRSPLPVKAEYNTAILGDVLEHMSDEDAVTSLRSAAACLMPGGKIIVTCPEDRRPGFHTGEYADGVSAGHAVPVTSQRLDGWLSKAGLKATARQAIDYGECVGHGVVAEAKL